MHKALQDADATIEWFEAPAVEVEGIDTANAKAIGVPYDPVQVPAPARGPGAGRGPQRG